MSISVSVALRRVLRLEALMVCLLSLCAYQQLGTSWWWFAGLLLLPDLALLGYCWGPRWGALSYNLMHSYLGPLLLGLAAYALYAPALPVAVVWVAHIALDRSLGYGLKSFQGFGWTHLGPIGRPAAHCHL